jgi:hypothetical protein
MMDKREGGDLLNEFLSPNPVLKHGHVVEGGH